MMYVYRTSIDRSVRHDNLLYPELNIWRDVGFFFNGWDKVTTVIITACSRDRTLHTRTNVGTDGMGYTPKYTFYQVRPCD